MQLDGWTRSLPLPVLTRSKCDSYLEAKLLLIVFTIRRAGLTIHPPLLVSSKLTDTNKEGASAKDQFMSKSKRTLSPKLKVKEPVSALFKLVKADFKDLFKPHAQ